MPESAGTPAPRREERRHPRFTRAETDAVRRASRQLIRGARASFASQAAFREALLVLVRRDAPTATIGPARLRRLLVAVPGIRLSVRYAERPGRTLPSACPVCGTDLVPVRNRTLTEETVVIGRRCTRCDYWTHRVCRVPVRYTVSQASGRRAPNRTE